MKEIKLKLGEINILAIILLFIPSIVFILIQLKLFQYIYIKVDSFIVLTTILIPFIHELLHFVGFIIFGRLKPNQLIFKSNKSSLVPYFRTTLALNKNDYILILLLPCITLTIFSIYLALINNNILFSILIGYSLSMSAGDLILVKELLVLNKGDKIIPSNDELGFAILNNTQKLHETI